MDASALNCPNCGAATTSDATQCDHCGAKLATVACPSCFGLIFHGSIFCPHCGAKIERTEETDDTPVPCPRCQTQLNAVALGNTNVHECAACAGLWIGVEAFNTICADREKQSAVIGIAPSPISAELVIEEIHYIACPICKEMMNRMNFANRSGIILDICRPHGVWFDRDELRRIVAFIRNGGLDEMRKRNLERFAQEKRKQPARSVLPVQVGAVGIGTFDGSDAIELVGLLAEIIWDIIP